MSKLHYDQKFYKINLELDTIICQYLEDWGRDPVYLLITQDQYWRLLSMINYHNRRIYGTDVPEVKTITQYHSFNIILLDQVATKLISNKPNEIPIPDFSQEFGKAKEILNHDDP